MRWYTRALWIGVIAACSAPLASSASTISTSFTQRACGAELQNLCVRALLGVYTNGPQALREDSIQFQIPLPDANLWAPDHIDRARSFGGSVSFFLDFASPDMLVTTRYNLDLLSEAGEVLATIPRRFGTYCRPTPAGGTHCSEGDSVLGAPPNFADLSWLDDVLTVSWQFTLLFAGPYEEPIDEGYNVDSIGWDFDVVFLPIPEPSTALLVAIGLAAMAITRQRL